jgi:hypothetical protein
LNQIQFFLIFAFEKYTGVFWVFIGWLLILFFNEFLCFLGVKGFKAIAGDLALGVQTQQLWAFQPLQSSQHLNLGITNLVDKAGNPLNKEGPQLLST